MILLIPSELQERAEEACKAIIAIRGQEKQFRKAQEELCECAAAINRMIDVRPESWEQVIEEAADVALCWMQVRMMLGAAVDLKIEEKLVRLEGRIADAESKEPK